MTVQELANECNVHYNTMRRWLSDNKIKKENNAKNGRFLLTDKVIINAKKHFLREKEKTTKDSNNIDNIVLQQLIQKDIQIVKQQEQIIHLQKLLENQQVLTLKTQEKLQLQELENKEHKKGLSKKKWKFWEY